VIESILPKLLPLPAPLWKPLARVLGFPAVEQTYSELRGDRGIENRLLDKLGITIRASKSDLDRIPSTGPTLILANHPFGILDGAVLAALLKRIRADVKFVGNDVLTTIPELRDLVLPVDVTGTRINSRGMRAALGHLEAGGCLTIFPAGEVSHFRWSNRSITDARWNVSASRLVEILARRGIAVSTVPAYVAGANSLLFQAAGCVHSSLRTALLVRELLNKRGQVVDVRIGTAIDSARLLELATPSERTEYLRWRTYLLASREKFKPKTSRPFVRPRAATVAAIAMPVDPSALDAEVSTLTPLVASSGLTAYIARADEIPGVLQEIGRLREATFRVAGEGTGHPVDLDRFDEHYLHLFVWQAEKREIVGAYRLCPAQSGDLYTRTLFRYGGPFLKKLGPAIELGRSFVRVEYQRTFAPLLVLWKGIGRFIAQHPQYRTLFGPVSISNEYQSISRELMVTYLERHASLTGWMNLVKSRNPFRRRKLELPANIDLEDLSTVVSDLEPQRTSIPILLRQYLRLGGKLLGFNVDPDFSNALDGLILVDLAKTERKLLERYLGKAEAAQFLEHQKGQHE